MRKHRIKLNIKTDKQLKELIACNGCGTLTEYGYLFFYVDGCNISITNNTKGICINCKNK